MFVGNVFYVTSCYNEVKFQLLLESHLSKRKGTELSEEFISQSLAAYLEFKDSKEIPKEVSKMEKLLDTLEINFSDYRTYGNEEVKGNPIDAVKAFNKIATDFIRSKHLEER